MEILWKVMVSIIGKMKQVSRKTRNGGTIISDFIAEDTSPHIKSLGAAILLREELRLQDVDFLADGGLAMWLEFREIYLKKVLAKEGDLVCVYCGKPHLEIGGRTPAELQLNNKNKNLATIDHIIPLSSEGEKYNEDNLCVACKKCNGKKGAKSVTAFIAPKTKAKYRIPVYAFV